MLICVVSGLLSLATASLAAALALVLTGCLSVDRAYRSIDWSIVLLVGGMLPLAMALERTGAAELIAGLLISAGGAAGPMGSLLLLYLFTTFFSQVVSNSVSAALMVPIALNLATAQGLSPHLFAVAIAVAATTSYITPLTNADNLLIREPGRYSMRDYLINNLPLYLLQTTAVMLILSVLL